MLEVFRGCRDIRTLDCVSIKVDMCHVSLVECVVFSMCHYLGERYVSLIFCVMYR